MALSPEEAQEFARRRLNIGSDAEIDRIRINQDRTLNTRLLNDASLRGQRDVGHQIAANGLYHSGIRVNEQGQIVRETNEALGDLELQTGRGLEDIARGQTRSMAEIDFAERSAMAAATRREAEEAQRRAELEAMQRAAPAPVLPPPPPVIIAPPPPVPVAPVDPMVQAAINRRNRYSAGPNPGLRVSRGVY
jgi:hypothetical protein